MVGSCALVHTSAACATQSLTILVSVADADDNRKGRGRWCEREGEDEVVGYHPNGRSSNGALPCSAAMLFAFRGELESDVVFPSNFQLTVNFSPVIPSDAFVGFNHLSLRQFETIRATCLLGSKQVRQATSPVRYGLTSSHLQ